MLNRHRRRRSKRWRRKAGATPNLSAAAAVTAAVIAAVGFGFGFGFVVVVDGAGKRVGAGLEIPRVCWTAANTQRNTPAEKEEPRPRHRKHGRFRYVDEKPEKH